MDIPTVTNLNVRYILVPENYLAIKPAIKIVTSEITTMIEPYSKLSFLFWLMAFIELD